MFTFDLQLFAHKKGVSSTRNGRDSESKRLGVKEQAGTVVTAGSILVRQRCSRRWPARSLSSAKANTIARSAFIRLKSRRCNRGFLPALSEGWRRFYFYSRI